MTLEELLDVAIGSDRKSENKRNILKPCPFCGSEAHIIERKPHETVLFYQVQCSTCSAGLSAGFARETDAIKAWNRREDGDEHS